MKLSDRNYTINMQDPDKSRVFVSANFPACFIRELIWTDDVFTSHTPQRFRLRKETHLHASV